MIILVLFYTAILVNLTFYYIIGPLEDCEYGHYGTECRHICGNCSGQVNVIVLLESVLMVACLDITQHCGNIGKLTTYLSHFTYFFEKYITPQCKLFIYLSCLTYDKNKV